MKDYVERELKLMQEFIEEWERNRPPEDTGNDDPDSPVPAPVKPRPLRAIGAEALLGSAENDTPLQQQKDTIARRNG